jgi:hypothetical protein
MRNGQNKRMRGRNRKSHNPLTKVYESNGPDVKIRGTASHVAEKYIQLARDAQTSSDPVGAENYYQHAEHYFRLIAAAQEQFRQNAQFYGNRPEGGGNDMRDGQVGNDMRDGSFEDEGDDDENAPQTGEQPQFGTRDPQPYLPRDAQFYQPQQEQPQSNPRQNNSNNNYNNNNSNHGGAEDGVDRLPSFITGGQPQQQAPSGQGYDNRNYENENNSGGGGEPRFQGERNERYGYRRRRHRRGGGGPRPDMQGNGMPQEGGDDSAH